MFISLQKLPSVSVWVQSGERIHIIVEEGNENYQFEQGIGGMRDLLVNCKENPKEYWNCG